MSAPRMPTLRSADRQRDRPVAARAVTMFAIFHLNHPDVTVPYNIVSDMRHILLPESSRRLTLDLIVMFSVRL